MLKYDLKWLKLDLYQKNIYYIYTLFLKEVYYSPDEIFDTLNKILNYINGV